MQSEKVGDLYFQKAESMRVTRLGFGAASIIGFLFTVATLIVGPSPEDIANGVLPILIFMGAVFVAIVVFDFMFKVNYEEYRAEYLSFYSVSYVESYLVANPKQYVLTGDDISEIARRMSMETGFDVMAVKDGIEVYLDRTYERCGSIESDPASV